MENKVLGPAVLKGVLKGEATVIMAQLKVRFGRLPEWVSPKLEQASETELLQWGKRLLTAPSLEAVFAD